MEGSPPQCSLISLPLSSRVAVGLRQNGLSILKFLGAKERVPLWHDFHIVLWMLLLPAFSICRTTQKNVRTAEVVGCLFFFRLFYLSLSFYNNFSITTQGVARVQSLMWQCTHLFHRLEAAKIMKAYVAQNVDENKDLFANLETAKSEAVVAQKLAKESVGFLRKRWLWRPRKKMLKKNLSG